MGLLSNLQLMSRYNQWLNMKVYLAAQELGNEKIREDKGAFFGSLLSTLNHIYVADVIWLRRFAQHSKQYQSLSKLPELASYTTLDLTVAQDIETLDQLRQKLDTVIVNWCQEIESDDLETNLQYADTKGNSYNKNLGQLVHNFFNHQTHHRGQATTLITQQGLDIGVTDLLIMIPEQ